MTGINIVEINDYYMVNRDSKYFKLGLIEGRILKGIIEGQSRETLASKENVTEIQIQQLEEQFQEVGILGEAKESKKNILFLKFPLFEIDNVMTKVCDLLKSKIYLLVASILIWLSIVITGITIVALNYNDIFQIESIILPGYQYLLAYILYFAIIVLHELSHGMVCKYFGGKVGKMGLAFIVFNPAMYCDISSVRLFKEKYKKVLSSMAGFMAQAFFIGVFALLYQVYGLNFFKIMIILNITTVLFNAIPFIRLDGYWILSFCVGIDNLYKKSLSMVRTIGKKTELKDWKDYFTFVYGILNTIVLSYFIITGIISIIQFVCKIIVV